MLPDITLVSGTQPTDGDSYHLAAFHAQVHHGVSIQSKKFSRDLTSFDIGELPLLGVEWRYS